MKLDVKSILEAQRRHFMFCRECGETDPQDGFYPLVSNAYDAENKPIHASNYICNECDRKIREAFQYAMKTSNLNIDTESSPNIPFDSGLATSHPVYWTKAEELQKLLTNTIKKWKDSNGMLDLTDVEDTIIEELSSMLVDDIIQYTSFPISKEP